VLAFWMKAPGSTKRAVTMPEKGATSFSYPSVSTWESQFCLATCAAAGHYHVQDAGDLLVTQLHILVGDALEVLIVGLEARVCFSVSGIG